MKTNFIILLIGIAFVGCSGESHISNEDNVVILNTQLQEDEIQLTFLSKDSQEVNLTVSYIYSPILSEVDVLIKEIGQNYNDNIIRPEVRNITIKTISMYTVTEIDSIDIKDLESDLFKKIATQLKARHIHLDSYLLFR